MQDTIDNVNLGEIMVAVHLGYGSSEACGSSSALLTLSCQQLALAGVMSST